MGLRRETPWDILQHGTLGDTLDSDVGLWHGTPGDMWDSNMGLRGTHGTLMWDSNIRLWVLVGLWGTHDTS